MKRDNFTLTVFIHSGRKARAALNGECTLQKQTKIASKGNVYNKYDYISNMDECATVSSKRSDVNR